LTKRQLTVILNNVKKKQYTIQELSDITGFSRRTIRYYIQEGLLPPPAGRGRGGFYYDSHLQKLSKIKTLQDKGLRLAAITEVLEQPEALEQATIMPPERREVWVKVPVADGVEIHIRRDTEEHQRKAITQVIQLAKSILTKENEGDI